MAKIIIKIFNHITLFEYLNIQYLFTSFQVMPIDEAIKQGLVRARPFNPKTDNEADEDVLTFQQLKIKQMTFKAGEPGLLSNAQPSVDDTLLDKLREKVDIDDVKVGDPEIRGEYFPLEDAVEVGLVSLAKDSYSLTSESKPRSSNGLNGGHSEKDKSADEKGNKLPLTEACMAGYVAPADLKQILRAYEDQSLAEPIKEGLFDPETGLITDPSTGKMLSLKAAIEAGKIDPDMTFFFDVARNKVSFRLEGVTLKIHCPCLLFLYFDLGVYVCVADGGSNLFLFVLFVWFNALVNN